MVALAVALTLLIDAGLDPVRPSIFSLHTNTKLACECDSRLDVLQVLTCVQFSATILLGFHYSKKNAVPL